MTPSVERRKSDRMPVSSLITCYMKMGDLEYQGGLRDMSLTGLYLELNEQHPVVVDKCEVQIVLSGKASRLRIEGLMGQIIRCDQSGTAIRLDDRMEWFPLVATYLACRKNN
jgi:hypothetical protein